MSPSGGHPAAARAGPSELALLPGSLAIADLHLEGSRPDGLAGFEHWLESLRGVPLLCILGDLFEFYVGPAQAREPDCSRVLSALADTVRSGTEVHLVHGNRDYLVGLELERNWGIRVHPQGVLGELEDGTRALLIHGDELATLDRGYQRLRRLLRSKALRALAQGLPYGVTRRLARGLRRQSRRAVAVKPAARMTLQTSAAAALAARHRARLLVCGHAHRFRDERLDGGHSWFVLDAFGGERDVVEFGRGDVRFSSSHAASSS